MTKEEASVALRAIRAGMKKFGFSRKDVAASVGKSYNTVSRWLNGHHEMQIGDVELLAAAWGMQPWEFLKMGELKDDGFSFDD